MLSATLYKYSTIVSETVVIAGIWIPFFRTDQKGEQNEESEVGHTGFCRTDYSSNVVVSHLLH